MAEESEGSPRRDETEQERIDRNLEELLQELRVALPGVQVLFAFLLVVPFNQRFTSVSDFDRILYGVTLVFAALASTMLISPTVHHRLLFRRRDKAHLVKVANRQAIVGLTFLAIAMTGAIVLVTDFLYKPATTIVASGIVALGFIVFWYALPLMRRARIGRD
jgi:hypothetical protein